MSTRTLCAHLPPLARAWLVLVALLAILACSRAGGAAETYALVVSGDPGHPVTKPDNVLGDWSTHFNRWRDGWCKLLIDTCHVPAAHLRALRSPDPTVQNDAVPPAELASRGQILSGIASIVGSSTPADQVILVLIGHGYHSGTAARFCLAGEDLTDSDLQQALSGLHCKELVLLVLAPDCRDIARTISGANRVIVLGNVKASAPYYSEFLLRTLAPGNVPLLTAFNNASIDNIHWYQNQNWDKEKKAWIVHGKHNQELWRLFYPRGAMYAGDDQPHVIVNTNDANRVDEIVGRRLIAEIAGLEDNGDGMVSTVYEGGPEPKPLDGKPSGDPDKPVDGALAATITLGKP